MKLKKLTLNNFRGFKHFECDFQENINVLVGLNGYGKSSVLDAIAVAYGQFMSGFGTSVDRGIREPEVHLAKVGSEQHGLTMEYQFPVTVSAQAYPADVLNFPLEWSRSLNTIKSSATKIKQLSESAEFLQKLVQDGAVPILPLISYYGTDRLWNSNFSAPTKPSKLQQTSRLEGYRDWLKPKSSYKSFNEWIYTATMASFERQMEQQEQLSNGNSLIKSNIHQEHLNGLRQALDTLLIPSGWSNVRYSASAKQLVATHAKQGDVPVTMLSDGVRNMIGMIADIAYRAIKLNPHLGAHAVTETQGIVLIDEVDMHLHPSWQRNILSSLQNAFPNIQFIVTTHSPLVISDSKGVNVCMLTHAEKAIILPELYGDDANTVLLEIMDTDIRNADINIKLNDLLDSIHDANIEKARAQLQALELELPARNFELSKARMLLRKKELSIEKNK